MYFTRTYSFEKSGKAGVIYSILKWDIYGIKFSFSFSYFLKKTHWKIYLSVRIGKKAKD